MGRVSECSVLMNCLYLWENLWATILWTLGGSGSLWTFCLASPGMEPARKLGYEWSGSHYSHIALLGIKPPNCEWGLSGRSEPPICSASLTGIWKGWEMPSAWSSLWDILYLVCKSNSRWRPIFSVIPVSVELLSSWPVAGRSESWLKCNRLSSPSFGGFSWINISSFDVCL